jgi:hypothetical protein
VTLPPDDRPRPVAASPRRTINSVLDDVMVGCIAVCAVVMLFAGIRRDMPGMVSALMLGLLVNYIVELRRNLD